MRNQKSEIITLSRRPFGDRDRLITALGKYTGRMALLAKGAQKPGSRLAGMSEPFVYAKVMIAAPKNISVIASADVLESFSGMKASLEGVDAAYHISRLAERISQPGQPSEGLFLNLLSCLYILESGADPETVKRYFELRLCAWAGCPVNHTRCACGRPLKEAFWSREAGFFTCRACAGSGDGLVFPAALFSYVRALEKCPENRVRFLSFPPEALADLKALFSEHMLYHLELRQPASFLEAPEK